MKKYLLLITSTFFTIALHAQNVGIGTSSPAQKLDVNGIIAVEGKRAIQGNDTWLRLNQGGDFTTGVYIPSFIRIDGGVASGALATPGGGAITASAFINSNTGFRISNAAASGNFLRGDGTNFVSSAIMAADIPAGSGNYIQNQYAGPQSANSWISGQTRTGAWFRNSATGTGLYNETDGSGIFSVGVRLLELFNSTSLRIQDAGYLDFRSGTRQMINLWGGGPNAAYGIGIQNNTLYNRTVNSFSWHVGGTHVNTANAPGAGGVEAMRLVSERLTVNGSIRAAGGAPGSNASINGYGFDGDGDTGMFVRGGTSPTFNHLSLYRNNVERVRIDSDLENYTSVSWTTMSDRRLKDNIKKLNNSLSKILNIQGVEYNYISNNRFEFPKKITIGFIAQDVEKILPEIVSTDEEGFKGIQYELFTPVLVEAIKEQQAIIEKLQQENSAKTKQIEIINSNFEKLNAELSNIKTLLKDQQFRTVK